MFGNKAITMQYPEEQHVPSANYRGVHRLNKDEQGRVKCVACMLCATACPAHCIDIVGATAPPTWPDREKYPESFVIDELRCIYCGMCEEACPVEAIELTGLYDLTGLSREEMIFDKTKLLSVFDVTKDQEPMRYGKPPAEHAPETKILPSLGVIATVVRRMSRSSARDWCLHADLRKESSTDDVDPRCDPGHARRRVRRGRHILDAAAPARDCAPGRQYTSRRRSRRAWRCLLFLASGARRAPSCRPCSFTSSAWPRSSAAFLTVTSRNPIYSALWFASVVLSTAGLFLLAGAPFLAAGTVIVYAGAIIVTFLFVIMLAQMEGKAALRPGGPAPGRRDLHLLPALLVPDLLTVGAHDRSGRSGFSGRPPLSRTNEIPECLRSATTERAPRRPRPVPTGRHRGSRDAKGIEKPNVAGLGESLYTDHLVTVGLAGVLLFVALVGAVAITNPKRIERPVA